MNIAVLQAGFIQPPMATVQLKLMSWQMGLKWVTNNVFRCFQWILVQHGLSQNRGHFCNHVQKCPSSFLQLFRGHWGIFFHWVLQKKDLSQYTVTQPAPPTHLQAAYLPPSPDIFGGVVQCFIFGLWSPNQLQTRCLSFLLTGLLHQQVTTETSSFSSDMISPCNGILDA